MILKKAVNELKQAGAAVTEQEKLNYMLKSLPQNYSHIGDLIDVLPMKERTVEYLKSKIKLKSMEEKSNNVSNDKSNVFQAEAKSSSDKNYTCFGCGKPGHLKRDCRSGSNRGRGRGGFSAFRGRGRGQNNFRNFHRGRGNFQNTNRESQGSSFNTIITNNISASQDHKPRNGQIEWLLDSGCTDHIINNDKYFDRCEILQKPIKVKIGDGSTLEATKVGNIKVFFTVYGHKSEVTLTNVFYVKQVKANLLSYSKITEKNSIVSRGRLSKIYNPFGRLIAVAIKDERLYKMRSYINEEKSQAYVCKNNMTLKEKLHRTLGHINFNNLEKMCKNEVLDGLPKEIESEYLKCATCIENKMHNLPFHNNRRRAEDILEIVHTDLNGPHQTTGYEGEKYFLTFIDDYSKLTKVYCIQTKTEVFDCLVQYVNEIRNLTGKMIKELRCDNGKEYINSRVFQFAKEKGIIIKPCPPYVHELNGTAERYNRSLMDMGRCLLSEAKIHQRFWPEIIKAAAYLKNRTLTNTIEQKTLYEIFFKQKPSVKNLRMYGSKVFVRIPKEKRRSKWDKKAEIGILLGYTDTGYRVLMNNRVIIARHCDIIEEDVNLCGFEDEERQSNYDEEKEIEKQTIVDTTKNQNEENLLQTNDNEEEDDEVEIKVKRSGRKIKAPLRFDEEFGYYCINVNYCDAMIPQNFQEAITSSESLQWKEAMNREMDSLIKNNTWTLVNNPVKDKRVIDVKWIYKKKNLKLKYYKSSSADILDCYVDSDWAGDTQDRKSTTGFVIQLFGNTILWKSKKTK
ncbi:hypothetical protein ILUMI_03950 [Ignelater luminosus]|uniref:Retrovirus-related Pol polyprotein from transposon TNT 1-94 n=1 Tax=Ignelater luminosus TaxID=2038154 RepID=A0A8K0GLN5_IGNLU|nr:hypothetical protein ILUMI_03950 [Ignelater luminosus]